MSAGASRPTSAGMKLVWSDEFEAPAGAPPDPRWWRAEVGGHGWGNGELQRYTDRTANAAHDGAGHLVIRAIRNDSGFTSARLVTKGLMEFRYGRLEVRARFPDGAGLWSAVWMLGANIDRAPWPACGEIDVVEHLGAEPAEIFGTVHCPGHCGAGGIGGRVALPAPACDRFSVYAVDWGPDSVAWSVDGRRYFRVTTAELGRAWVFDHPFFLLVNLAVGGTLGRQAPSDAHLPGELVLDHVRVFQAADQEVVRHA